MQIQQQSCRRIKYLPASIIQQSYHISQATTLRRWANHGIVRCVRYSANGKRLYNIADLCQHLCVLSLLECVLRGVVQEVVELHKDRLCHYGVELLEPVF